SPVGVTHELRRMNTYGVLGRYIPAFGRIVGRMQYDLFHAYTVGAHTLFVVSNLRRFAIPRYDHELPEASRVMQQLPRSEVAYLAALFHDIAKGRGGDHSELGAVDAEAFCLEQGLSPYDARLVAWLVRNHLQLSITSQKQDIGDPQVINAFARKVGDETHLDYLYVLTCADVRGTTAALIFTRPRRHGFARTTAALDQLGLNIVDARITPTGDGFSLDLYHLLEDDGAPITDNDRQVEIEQALWGSLRGAADAPF